MDFTPDKDEAKVLSLGQIDINIDASQLDLPPCEDDLPILPTRNLVLFPHITLPITLVRENSVTTARLASERHIPIGIVCQVSPDIDDPTVTGSLHKYGVIADVLKVLVLPDNTRTAIVRARRRFRITGRGNGRTMPEARLSAKIKIPAEKIPVNDKEFDVLVEHIKSQSVALIEKTTDMAGQLVFSIKNASDPELIINEVCTHLPFEKQVKQRLLAQGDLKKRAFELMTELNRNSEMVNISQEIMQRTRSAMDQNQRNAFLQQQMETIREELYGGETDDVEKLTARAAEAGLPKNIEEIFGNEIEHLRRLNPQSPDYSVQYNYIDLLLSVPWTAESEINTDFDKAAEILDNDHYGLEKVKERILEQLAVLMHNPDGKAPILCLVGAPGVGKTSLGASVARALGRKYQRVSLGGLHDEAEIRGHRRTYIGAMPGRIIEAMRRAGTRNPVLLLDEVDKIGSDYKGDPAAALLEVLDPEQNCHFHDNYLDIDYDLSHVLFIATANTLSTLSRPLLDRMEIIDLSGYLAEEKMAIARRYLLPRIAAEHNIDASEINIGDSALAAVIEEYTAESGVRQLGKRLASIVRKYVLAKMSGKEFPATVEASDLKAMLGMPVHNRERYEGNEFAGVVTGLAWTEVGGEILLVESSVSPGKGDRLTLTGNLGDVMKESATIALQWIKAHSRALGIDSAVFDRNNLHIHFPEGAVPKDGPSAGITIATSLVSLLTGRRVMERVAMTGEITLRGKVLPVGGIKEKILAAKRAGITDIILSADNRKDIDDIDARYIDGLTFHYVNTVMEVMRLAITDTPAIDAPELTAGADAASKAVPAV